LIDNYQPIVLLNDGETFTGLGGCELIVLTHEEAERVADDDCLGFVKALELEEIVRWAFANGYQPG
jgi:hypothetical protein